MDPLPPIPSDPRVLWRQFRIRVLPLLIFLGLVASAVVLWRQVKSAPTLAGIAEGPRALVTSPQTGRILELKVRPYQLVNQGDPIAVIEPTDPRMPLELLRTELQLTQMRQEPTPAQQNAMNYQRVRVEYLRLRAELAVARINLRRAENELNRNRPLYEGKLLSEDLFDLSLQNRDALQAEVKEKEQAVADMEQHLEALRQLGDPMVTPADDRLEKILARLEAAQEQCATNWGPFTLFAPLSGMVAPVYRQAGETLLEGEPLVAIQSLWSDHVVAYLRQPYPIDPEIGMPAKVITRTRARQQLSLSISHIGAQVEIITNALAFVRQGALVDVGLPIILDLPAQTRIRPGELVDVWIDRSPPPARANPPEKTGL